jgi:hypothetical protein
LGSAGISVKAHNKHYEKNMTINIRISEIGKLAHPQIVISVSFPCFRIPNAFRIHLEIDITNPVSTIVVPREHNAIDQGLFSLVLRIVPRMSKSNDGVMKSEIELTWKLLLRLCFI